MVDHPHDPTPHPDGEIRHANVSHERTDMSLGWILTLLAVTAILGVIVWWSILLFFRSYRNYEANIKKPDLPLAQGPSEAKPPRPRLEQVDRLTDKENVANIRETDLQAIESAKLHFLESWQDLDAPGRQQAQQSHVHIPIQVAISLVGKNPEKYGAAYRKTAPSNMSAKDQRAERGLVDSGGANSGRMFRAEARWFDR
jgi:hypothetical protein